MSSRPRSQSPSSPGSEPDDDRANDRPITGHSGTYVHEPQVSEPGGERRPPRVAVAVRLPNSMLVHMEVGNGSIIDVRAAQAAARWGGWAVGRWALISMGRRSPARGGVRQGF